MPILAAPVRATVTSGSVFLAGSIDMGEARDWQTEIIELLPDLMTIFNPRRKDWDSSWEQDISCPEFREQVEWELDHLAMADAVAFYFDPSGPAPITLLELGLMANCHKAVVCCPPAYWRRGNVQIVCARYGIEMVDTVEELANRVVKMVDQNYSIL